MLEIFDKVSFAEEHCDAMAKQKRLSTTLGQQEMSSSDVKVFQKALSEGPLNAKVTRSAVATMLRSNNIQEEFINARVDLIINISRKVISSMERERALPQVIAKARTIIFDVVDMYLDTVDDISTVDISHNSVISAICENVRAGSACELTVCRPPYADIPTVPLRKKGDPVDENEQRYDDGETKDDEDDYEIGFLINPATVTKKSSSKREDPASKKFPRPVDAYKSSYPVSSKSTRRGGRTPGSSSVEFNGDRAKDQ